MIPYVVPYIYITLLTLGYCFSNSKKEGGRLLLFLFILPALLIAVLRGNIGTDTYFYLGMFQNYQEGYTMADMEYEPGFLLLGYIISQLGFGPRAGVAIIGLITTMLLLGLFSKTKDKIALFGLVFFPIFYVDFTMNGLRYGLSFAIAGWAVYYLYQKKYITFGILSVLALSMQYSALIVIAPFLASLVRKKYLILFFAVMLPLIFLTNTFNFILTHLAGKQDAYKNIQAPGALSGVATLIIFLLIYFFFIYYSEKKTPLKLLTSILVLELISFGIARFTYAGLRIQSAFLFVLIIFVYNNLPQLEKRQWFFFRMSIVSLLSFAIFYKNLSASDINDLTPFIPYKFYWQEAGLPF